MKHRFFVPPEAIAQGQVRFPETAVHQIVRVLRLRPGDLVTVLDGEGRLYHVSLQQVSRHEVVGRIIHEEPAGGEPRLQLDLYMALIKGERFDWVLQKGTELGVSRFIPMVTERTVVRDLSPSPHRRARWARIVQEAAEQCGRARLPAIASPLAFTGACAEAANAEVRLIAWTAEARRSLPAACGERRPKHLALLIGPEGGFTDDEVAQAHAHGITPFSLGPRVLRAETAAIVAVALAMHQAGELAPQGPGTP